jgi:hypothetical protein
VCNHNQGNFTDGGGVIQMPIEMKYTQDELLFSTVRIGVEGDNEASLGTGLLIKYRIPDDTEKFHVFLVTCKHVFEDPHRQISIKFHTLGKTEKYKNYPDLGRFLELSTQSYKDGYFEHPDPEIDLCCLQLTKIVDDTTRSNDSPNIFFKAGEPGFFATFEEEVLLPGTEVFAIGYPEDEYDVFNNLPLMRCGNISSHPKIDYNGYPVFLIDAETHPGMSGGPVFAKLGSEVRVVGMVSDMLATYHPIKRENSEEGDESESQIRMGLGIVIKANKIKELLDHSYQRILEIGGLNK